MGSPSVVSRQGVLPDASLRSTLRSTAYNVSLEMGGYWSEADLLTPDTLARLKRFSMPEYYKNYVMQLKPDPSIIVFWADVAEHEAAFTSLQFLPPELLAYRQNIIAIVINTPMIVDL